MSTPGTEYLTEAECWSRLHRHVVARLAVDVGGRPDIFPINYVIDDGTIVFRSGAGTKLAGAVLGRHVAIEIDGLDIDGSVWSVVVKGIAHEITEMTERFQIDELPLYPWITSHKPNFVRIEPHLTTGRRFQVAERDPAHEFELGLQAEQAEQRERERDEREHHPGAPRLRPG
jgi:nitroimidazol reductase NimA-like FMN-containing flavoprotein (pyridoxamine 5'-phosphate oxidase superfamily)